ncbi:uncharacterized protein LOC119105954 [Pollicipes pollicipes]|uniref:uncharacterized protein LOC119105954 n=1 Tax=Pollicipes pollicipes TaxID=41117 RepID=UPI001884C317|nr:uncharacterized protein LOC119105954 [Pollicipes pollicipes]
MQHTWNRMAATPTARGWTVPLTVSTSRWATAGVRLACQPGYRANCTDVTSCRDVASGAVRLSCLPLTCPPPPAIPHAVVQAENGTAWMAVTEYACAAGYQLYPLKQRTTAVCEDGLWSLSHVVCLPLSDIRVVALRMSQQHQQSVSTLRNELEELLSGQQQLLQQLSNTQRRLQRLEEEVGLSQLMEIEQQLVEGKQVALQQELVGGQPEHDGNSPLEETAFVADTVILGDM